MTRSIIGCALTGIFLAFLHSAPASAQIVKCKSSSGQVTYTQNTCPPGTTPLEVSDSISAESGRTSAGAGTPRSLSARAAALKAQSDACLIPSSAGCTQYLALQKSCTDREKWDSVDCKALREVMANELARSREVGASFSQREADRCSGGDQASCIRAACTVSMLFDGTVEDLKRCARSRNFPIGRTWAQFESGAKSYIERIEGEGLSIACFELMEFRNPVGAVMHMHPTTMVTQYQRPGARSMTYRVNDRDSPDFSTLDEAATAGCEAEKARMAQRARQN